MTGVWEAAWVIARRDFVATVYSRSFVLFLIVPLALFAAMIGASLWIDDADANAAQPRVAVVADTETAQALRAARQRLADALTPIDHAQILNYLKASGHDRGLLLNFGARSLQHQRVVLTANR